MKRILRGSVGQDVCRSDFKKSVTFSPSVKRTHDEIEDNQHSEKENLCNSVASPLKSHKKFRKPPKSPGKKRCVGDGEEDSINLSIRFDLSFSIEGSPIQSSSPPCKHKPQQLCFTDDDIND